MGLRERKKQATRDAIAAAALRLFREHGFDAVTVADVAAAAEVSVKTVFNYFPSKQDLLAPDTIVEQALRDAVIRRPPGEPVLAALRRLQLGTLSPAQFAAFPFPEYARVVAASPALQAHVRLLFDRYQDVLARLLAEDTGAHPEDQTPRIAAALLIATMRCVFTTGARLAADRENPDELRDRLLAAAEQAYSLLATGLAAYGGRPPEPPEAPHPARERSAASATAAGSSTPGLGLGVAGAAPGEGR